MFQIERRGWFKVRRHGSDGQDSWRTSSIAFNLEEEELGGGGNREIRKKHERDRESKNVKRTQEA